MIERWKSFTVKGGDFVYSDILHRRPRRIIIIIILASLTLIPDRISVLLPTGNPRRCTAELRTVGSIGLTGSAGSSRRVSSRRLRPAAVRCIFALGPSLAHNDDFGPVLRHLANAVPCFEHTGQSPAPRKRGCALAQVDDGEILRRTVAGEIPLKDGVSALLDRTSGFFRVPESSQLDYKREVRIDSGNSVAEIARDVLAFSNTDGGLLIIGVADNGTVVGHETVDGRRLRDSMGPFIGTRVTFEMDHFPITVRGASRRLLALHVPRSVNAYPNLLRKDVDLRPGLVRKLKYLKGTLFYRLKDETFSESPYEDVESRARELRFSGAAPRTRTSFLLEEDKPGLRLYAPINDRFFGRDAELAELIAKFDDPRGRGVSIAGFGGVGKTELAIRLVSELHRRGKFRTVYSGSAKQTLLGPGGVQQTDPVFIDLRTFLADLAAWLGLSLGLAAGVDELSRQCVEELARDPNRRVLLLVDNLETITDRELVEFLDNKLPSNCWLVATARVHRVRNFVYPKELREMDADSAARLLRHELKRQGLDELAATHIGDLKTKAERLYLHPLALRWFAWACKKTPELWSTGISLSDKRELEAFCVAHTLDNLDRDTQQVLGAILAISDAAEPTALCIQQTSGLAEPTVEMALWELECSGLLYAGTDQDGVTTYAIAALAEKPASELARNRGWEAAYVSNFRAFVRQQADSPPESALVRDLLKIEPRRIQQYTRGEIAELNSRIERSLPRASPRHALKLRWLRAECERHLGNLITADDLYRRCAEAITGEEQSLATGAERAQILLEAATVAKARAQTDPQLRRAVQYLLAIGDTEFSPMRVIGMLTEFSAMLGDLSNYRQYAARAATYKAEHSYERFDNLEDALARAEGHIQRRASRARI